jgi:mycothiol S-conjugate amidase
MWRVARRVAQKGLRYRDRLALSTTEGDFRVLRATDNGASGDRSAAGGLISAALPGLEPLRLMAVHAHPDDESSKGAATMARYVREGVEVLVCTLTGGERGDILNPAMERPEIRASLPDVRRAEMARAREILGVEQRFLGFVDSGLPEGDPLPALPDGCFALQPLEKAARPLVQAVREFRPHVMLTYDENGGYPHPDHIKCHQVSVEAFEAAADPDRYEGCGEPWQPLKLYYFLSFHRDRMTALHDEMIRRGLESPYAERVAEWAKEDEAKEATAKAAAAKEGAPKAAAAKDGAPNTGEQNGRPGQRRSQRHEMSSRIECGEYFEIRNQALIAHATQVDPNGGWFAVPTEVQRAVWPTEDYHLARSLVDAAEQEDDLFAGIRERVSFG